MSGIIEIIVTLFTFLLFIMVAYALKIIKNWLAKLEARVVTLEKAQQEEKTEKPESKRRNS